MNFIRRLNNPAIFLSFGDLLVEWKLVTNAKIKHNISKIMPARPKKNRDMGCEYHYSIMLVSGANILYTLHKELQYHGP